MKSKAEMNAYKKLYDAQVKEHEKTHERLRASEKENANLRGLIGSQQRDYTNAVTMLQRIADSINKIFPKEKN